MTHPEKRYAKRIDTPDRARRFTDLVYNRERFTPEEGWKELRRRMTFDDPPKNEFGLFFGDLHGHTNLSDGSVDVDTFFRNLRDRAKVDFCALTDHDHGGVGRPTLWEPDPATGLSKWDVTLQKCDEYDAPGRFTTIPGYERDSYPWMTSLILYCRSTQNARMIRGAHDGELTASELRELHGREDILYGPHDCSMVGPGCDLNGRPECLMPKTFEIYQRDGAFEYYDNPYPAADGVRGCNYIDALENGAHLACIGCSDDHGGRGGQDLPSNPGKGYRFTGMTGVYAQENTREGIFDALKARRCYAFMGESRIRVDLRINNHYMGEIIEDGENCRTIWYEVDGGDVPVERVDVIKNGRSYVFLRGTASRLFYDYQAERAEDYYYLRVRMADGRYAWTRSG